VEHWAAVVVASVVGIVTAGAVAIGTVRLSQEFSMPSSGTSIFPDPGSSALASHR
jgi:hypothetical protein